MRLEFYYVRSLALLVSSQLKSLARRCKSFCMHDMDAKNLLKFFPSEKIQTSKAFNLNFNGKMPKRNLFEQHKLHSLFCQLPFQTLVHHAFGFINLNKADCCWSLPCRSIICEFVEEIQQFENRATKGWSIIEVIHCKKAFESTFERDSQLPNFLSFVRWQTRYRSFSEQNLN